MYWTVELSKIRMYLTMLLHWVTSSDRAKTCWWLVLRTNLTTFFKADRKVMVVWGVTRLNADNWLELSYFFIRPLGGANNGQRTSEWVSVQSWISIFEDLKWIIYQFHRLQKGTRRYTISMTVCVCVCQISFRYHCKFESFIAVFRSTASVCLITVLIDDRWRMMRWNLRAQSAAAAAVGGGENRSWQRRQR